MDETSQTRRQFCSENMVGSLRNHRSRSPKSPIANKTPRKTYHSEKNGNRNKRNNYNRNQTQKKK